MAAKTNRTHVKSDQDRSPIGASPWALSRGEWLPTVVSAVRFEVPVGAPAASSARHQVVKALGNLLSETERSNLELMISELVTNCVRHAGMDESADRIKVHAGVAPDRLRIEVCDTGRGFEPGPPQLRSLEAANGGLRGEGGLGLVLLDRLAACWGVAAEHEVCVWAEFDRESGELAA
jgi:anti-sigma regulatory factor (Ser/Thr protein kinase)